MKNIIHISLLFLTTLCFSQSIERQVIGTSGSTLTDGTTASVDFTVGELVTKTLTDGTTTFTQGFHQGELPLAIKINPIVFLQGAYLNPNIGEEMVMRDDLRIGNYIPTTSPYIDVLTCDASVFTITGDDAIVDWVWVELRDATDNTIIVDGQSALLQRDGDVVGVDGVSPLTFAQLAGAYYITINHRNHLGIMSASTITLNSSTTLVDLSANPIAVLGGTNAVQDMGNGIYAMQGGDFNDDGQILNTDITSVLLLTGTAGYSKADSDLNGQILNTDITLIIQPNSGKGQQY